MIDINNSVKYLKTVGSRREQYLNELGIYTVKDLLYYLPRNIEDRKNIFLSETIFIPLKKVVVIGKILSYKILYTKNKFGIFKSLIKTETKTFPLINLVWFKKINHKYDVFATLKKNVGEQYLNKYIIAYGRVSEKIKHIPEVFVEDYELIDDLNKETIHTKRLVPIYSLNTNISQQWFRELMFNTLNDIFLTEHLPKQILKNENLLDLNTAIKNVHFPESWQLYSESRKRLVFDKFLFLQLKIQLLKKDIMQKKKVGNYELKKFLLTPFKNKMLNLIPNFDFTKSQKKVINELFNDMMSKTAMNRILLGDVGSGKTLVAISCILLAIENGYQVVFMAPTEILAQQHYFNLETYFKDIINPVTRTEIRVGLYLGKTTKKEKDKILEKLNNGQIDLIIGTH
jgi:ATP-dependent DNA helicase RecG